MSHTEPVPLREWGTRYDSLSTSPSPSTASSLSRNPPTTTGTSTSTANSSLLVPPTVAPAKCHAQGDKLSHEASVFVGSLPTNVDHAELSARLKDHLSCYVEVNLVRIIRDSRGGVCAFVQCDDPASASKLIQTVHSLPPQSFMGRYLRFEPARSQRTLWISYRKPVEFIRGPDHNQSALFSNLNGRIIEFDLPKAMGICRTPGSRRINILYNAQALQFDDNANKPLSHPPQEQDTAVSALSGVDLVLSPLQFDSQTLHQITSCFGSVESFDLRQPEPAGDSGECLTYPYPHNTDRSAGMDPGCWEVKWENRNDCLNALATLRNVPHLTVTWPNQQHALIRRRNGPSRGHQIKDHLMFKRQSGLQQIQTRRGDDGNMTSEIVTSLSSRGSWDDEVNTAAATVGSQSSSGHLSAPNDGDPPLTRDDWAVVDARNNTNFQDALPPTPDTVTSRQLEVSQAHLSDVPPGAEDKRDGDVLYVDGVPSCQSSNPLEWSEIDNLANSKGGATSSPASPLNAPVHGGDAHSPAPVTALTPPFVENLASPFNPRSPGPTYPQVGSGLNFYDTFAIPLAPHWEARPRKAVGPCDENMDINMNNAFDPTTIFVGGLEIHGRCTWDEERLRRVFGQYGEIAEVKLVRPAHRKSAFAFVTYKSNRSSSRAVLAEHNRIYDGRHIRVQLRDSAVPKIHGSKSNLKSSEGRLFGPRHQISSKINGSPVDSLLHVQNGIRSAIPAPCEEPVPALLHSPNGPDTRGRPGNVCMPSIPSQASSTMVASVPLMTYPPPPTAFYAPPPWFMHPYPYAPPPHIIPSYPQFPLASSVVGMNEPSRPIPPNTMYQPIPHYSAYPLPLPPIPQTRQQHGESAGVTERRAPLQPTGFIESEQGLIPVYAPEALGEYMASIGSHQNVTEPEASQSELHPPKLGPEARSSQPAGMYAVYPPPQYHPPFARDGGTILMTGQSPFLNTPNAVPVGTVFNWYHDTTRAQLHVPGARIAAAPMALMGQPPRCQGLYSERGFGIPKRRSQGDRSTYARTGRGNNHPGTYITRRRGYFKHTGGAVSMSAVTDQRGETGLEGVVVGADPVVRASTSSPAAFDLTPTSPI